MFDAKFTWDLMATEQRLLIPGVKIHHFKYKVHHFECCTEFIRPIKRPHIYTNHLIQFDTDFIILNTKFIILNTEFITSIPGVRSPTWLQTAQLLGNNPRRKYAAAFVPIEKSVFYNKINIFQQEINDFQSKFIILQWKS